MAEATLTNWLKNVGDTIEIDDAVVEVSTDKVDSDVPSEVSGVLLEQRFSVNDVIQVGEIIAVIESEAVPQKDESAIIPKEQTETAQETPVESIPKEILSELEAPVVPAEVARPTISNPAEEKSTLYLSPLVKNIMAKEGISQDEIEKVLGTGENQRITKKDILHYLEERKLTPTPEKNTRLFLQKDPPATPAIHSGDQVIEMSRMAKLISSHMTESKNTSVHVQSFVEADVTKLWDWRNKIKDNFLHREGEKLTFTPIFIAAIIHAIKEFPLLNSSVNGNQIVQKKDINIGMATALGDGNLIVPVIKKADHLNLVGLAKAVNDLSARARTNQLLPEEIKEGTYTMTNIGNFGSITGTPIINQPQVGILALGVIRKMPAVIETPNGDFVGIRRKIILSHSYDHRIINGAMGGQFAKAVADYLENWDTSITF